MESQLQEAHDAKTLLEADVKQLQSLPAEIRELEVLCARKDREVSLLQVIHSYFVALYCNAWVQVAVAQAQEELKIQGARARSEAFMVDRRLVSNLLVQVIYRTMYSRVLVLKNLLCTYRIIKAYCLFSMFLQAQGEKLKC